MTRKLLSLVIIHVLAFLSTAHCQDMANDDFDTVFLDQIAASARQAALTEDLVNRLIESYPEMRAAAAKFAPTQLPDQLPSAGVNSDLDAMADDKRNELEAIAAKYGFKTLDEWSVVASSVAMSYAYAMQGKRPGALEEAVRLNTAQAERDPTLTEQQRQKTIAKYRELGAKLARLEPTKENFELVVRMKDKITAIMDPD